MALTYEERIELAQKSRKAVEPNYTLTQAILDPNLFGPWFKEPELWVPWMSFIKAVFGYSMTPDEFEIYKLCTGRDKPPTKRFQEIVAPVGRRGGKSFIISLVAVYLAAFHDWKRFLAPGERATVMIIAANRKQARVIFRYISAFLQDVPMIKNLIERSTAEQFDLKNQVTIEIQTASFRSIRGYSVAACLCDEVAFWRDDSSMNPDYEILNAIRPSMSSVPGAMLFLISSPYGRSGELYNLWKKYHGKNDSNVLVWQASTLMMNPTIPKGFIDEAYERDFASADAEYGGNFRSDVESIVSQEVVDACTDFRTFERVPQIGEQEYLGFVDPSGGSQDSFTMAIAHRNDNGIVELDLVRETKPPFVPSEVVKDYSETLAKYGIYRVYGDRYAGVWPEEEFKEHGIMYETNDKPKSDIYRELIPMLNSTQVRLLDNSKMISQLIALERRTARGGRDSIDHPTGGHDDIINAAAGAIVKVGALTPLEIW